MVSLNKFIYSFNFKKKKRIIKIISSKYANKKMITSFVNSFYNLYWYFSISTIVKKRKNFFFVTKFNFRLKKRNMIEYYFKNLKNIKKIIHYNITFLDFIEQLIKEFNLNSINDDPYDDDLNEILLDAGYVSTDTNKFSLEKVRNIIYDTIYVKGWFI